MSLTPVNVSVARSAIVILHGDRKVADQDEVRVRHATRPLAASFDDRSGELLVVGACVCMHTQRAHAGELL